MSSEAELNPEDCTCLDDGGCIDYYDESRPGDCGYCLDMQAGSIAAAFCPAISRWTPESSPVASTEVKP